MLKPATLQVLIKFPANEHGQVFALAGQFGLEIGPVFLDDLIEQGRLGPVTYVDCSGVCGELCARAMPWGKQILAVFACDLAEHNGFILKAL